LSAANETFSAVMSQVPSGVPHPDGTQRIHNASRELDAAREEMMKANTRLNNFIEHGIVPERLKLSVPVDCLVHRTGEQSRRNRLPLFRKLLFRKLFPQGERGRIFDSW